jgi:hypothetical protein
MFTAPLSALMARPGRATTAVEQSQSSGRVAYQTKELLDADLEHAAETLAEVTNDNENNGTYIKVGASGAEVGSRVQTT